MDYLDEIIETSKQESDFAQAWAPVEVMLDLVKARVEQGMTQEQVASKLGVDRARIAEMERRPDRVSFGRIVSYAIAVGATLSVKRARPARKKAAQKRGRPIGTGKPAAMVAKERGT